MDAAPSAPPPQLLIHVLPEELRAAHWQDALCQLAARFALLAGLPSSRPLVESAMQREECEPTYLGKGMALPHARVPGLHHTGICLAHSPSGIPWHEEAAQLIILLVVPEEQPELYLKLMSRLVRWRLRLPADALTTPALPARAWEEELRAILAP